MKRFIITLIFIFSVLCSNAMAESVTLGWGANTAPDLVGYNIYRSTTPDGQTIGNIEENPCFIDFVLCYANDATCTEYVDSDIPYDETFYWVVTAIDSSNNESGKSNEVSYHSLPEPDVTPPANPTDCFIKSVQP